MMNVQDRKAQVAGRFEELFHASPTLWGRAPGRVDLMGSHTDYNLGYVMTMSIDRDTWIAARPRLDRKVAVYSMNLGRGAEFGLDGIRHDQEHSWTNYIRGMAKVLQEAGFTLSGFSGVVHSTVPLRSGLSSSAALEMATGTIFQRLSGFRLEPAKLALLGQRAENSFVGVNCGILDQYTSAMGQGGCSLLLDCRDLTSRAMPMAAGIQVIICDTQAGRSLVGSEYGERRAQCEEGVRILRRSIPKIQSLRDVSLEQFLVHRPNLPTVVAKRCQFIIEENQRVLDLEEAMSDADWQRLHSLYLRSYEGARDLYEISAPAMEAMMEAMLNAPGVIAARQAGAGFGGCMISLIEDSQTAACISSIKDSYRQKMGHLPSVYPVQPAPGAGLLI